MKKTKVVAFDVYGTMLPTKGEQVKIKGLDSLLQRCKDKGLILCTCSDANTDGVLEDFKEAGLNPNHFNKFFEMERKSKNFIYEPKDFTPILKHYNLTPKELLVIGDRYERDIKPAKELGCKAIQVPEYVKSNKNNIDLDNFIDLQK